MRRFNVCSIIILNYFSNSKLIFECKNLKVLVIQAQQSVKLDQFVKNIGKHTTSLFNFKKFTFIKNFLNSEWWSQCSPIPTGQTSSGSSTIINRSGIVSSTTISNDTNGPKRKQWDQCGGYLNFHI